MLELKRPLVFFDLETTGVDVAADRIVEIAIIRLEPHGEVREWICRVNPGVPIPAAASAIHGIYDKDVENEVTFDAVADRVIELLEGADIAGYNSNNFDIPLLAEELLRVGREIDLSDVHCIDVMTIFQKKESRTLEAAVCFYCGQSFENAHCALDDARATRDVFFAQLERYRDLPREVSELAVFSRHRRNADLAGRLLYDGNGEVIFAFGKYKNQRVKDIFSVDPGYFDWIMRSDFPAYTKSVLRRIKESM